MKALILSCTLKKFPDPSNTAMLADEIVAGLEERGVRCEILRLMDMGIKPGASADEGDEWPWEKILASGVVALTVAGWLLNRAAGVPVWSTKGSSGAPG